MKKESKMFGDNNIDGRIKKPFKNQKVNATLQFLRRFPDVQARLKLLTIIKQKKPKKAL